MKIGKFLKDFSRKYLFLENTTTVISKLKNAGYKMKRPIRNLCNTGK